MPLNARIIEPHAVNDGLFRNDAEEPRRRIPRLWPRRKRAYFYETKSQRTEPIHRITRFI
jgi:hypothetical protein